MEKKRGETRFFVFLSPFFEIVESTVIYRAALVTPSSSGAKNTPRNENLDQSDFPNPRFEKKSEKNTQKMTIFGDLLFYRSQSSNSIFSDGVLTTI